MYCVREIGVIYVLENTFVIAGSNTNAFSPRSPFETLRLQRSPQGDARGMCAV
jgi:hypothetical protein